MAETQDVQPVSDRPAPMDLKSALETNPKFLRGKTIVITGGASGIGAAIFSAWAAHGPTILVGDTDTERGNALINRVTQETGNQRLHFMRLDVCSWISQVRFFQEAVKLSPHGGIDTVVANAGVSRNEEERSFQDPQLDLGNSRQYPSAPPLTTISVNLIGVLFTTHLALYYLSNNPGSQTCSPDASPQMTLRDRHLLLVGSLASLYPIPGQVLYGVSKHAVIGLYRSLRTTAPITHGIRVNILCPYFIDTPLLSNAGRALLSGCALAKIDDAVKAATRFAADPTCIGRALVVGPRVTTKKKNQKNGKDLAGAASVPNVNELYEYLKAEHDGEDVTETAIWECYAHDLEDSDEFMRRVINLTKAAAKLRGTRGFMKDVLKLLTSPLSRRSDKK